MRKLLKKSSLLAALSCLIVGTVAPVVAFAAPTINEFSIPTAISNPDDITAGPDGNLWFTEDNGNKIGKITPSGTFTEYPVPTASSDPHDITVGPDGNLWFTELTGNKIGQFVLASLVATPATTPATAAAAAPKSPNTGLALVAAHPMTALAVSTLAATTLIFAARRLKSTQR